MLALWLATQAEHGAHAAEHGHAAGEAAHHASGSAVPELPNLIGTLHHMFPAAFAPLEHFAESMGFADPMGTPFTALENVIFAIFAIVALSIFFISASRKLTVAPPKEGRMSKRAAFVEIVAVFFEDFFGAILGKDQVRRHLPVIGTLFIYILALNTMGLLFLGKAPTANLSFSCSSTSTSSPSAETLRATWRTTPATTPP
jgi:F0F1-type ATP synthase membrane subunit a